jgi:hypothetical protein
MFVRRERHDPVNQQFIELALVIQIIRVQCKDQSLAQLHLLLREIFDGPGAIQPNTAFGVRVVEIHIDSWLYHAGSLMIKSDVFCSIRRRFKRVIQVRMIPAAPQPCTYQPVYRQQKRPPPLKLANMGHFVRPAPGQAIGVASQYDVPKRHRCAAPAQPAAPKEPTHHPTKHFDHAASQPHGPAGCERQQCEQQTDKRNRGSPQVANKLHTLVVSAAYRTREIARASASLVTWETKS